MSKWEYNSFEWNDNLWSDMAILNRLGSDGWELVQIVGDKAILKKKVSSERKEKESSCNDDDFVDMIYDIYPTKCPQRGTSLGKSRKDKERIKRLLKTYTKEQIEAVVKKEVDDKYNKEYMQNFSTFLNNFPDPTLVEVKVEEEKEKSDDKMIINGVCYR